jgi:hypothetical protein
MTPRCVFSVPPGPRSYRGLADIHVRFEGAAFFGVLLFIVLDFSIIFKDFLVLAFVLFPFAAISIDGFLLWQKNKIWNTLPTDFVTPEHWKITEEELLKYLKNMPKIRLMRILSALVLLLCWIFISKDFALGTSLLKLFPKFFITFCLASSFDWVWKKVFKLKNPNIFVWELRTPDSRLSTATDGIAERVMNESIFNSNPYTPGSTAWFTRNR